MTTDTTTATLGVLTADDLAAFKLADSVTFHHSTAEHGGPMIRLHLDGGYADAPRIFTAKEQRTFPMPGSRGDRDRYREIPVESNAYGYESVEEDCDGWRSENRPNLACYHMISSAKYAECWPTVVGLLKAGDRLTLRWVADNNTDNIRNAGLHNDHLRLYVYRGNPRKSAESISPMVFPIANSVCPDNTARMIKENGY